MANNFFAEKIAGKKRKKAAVEKGKKAIEEPMTSTTTKSEEGTEKKPVEACKFIVCEDPLTGDFRMFPVKCPPGYVEKIKSRMREKGVRFSSKPLPEDVVLILPEEE